MVGRGARVNDLGVERLGDLHDIALEIQPGEIIAALRPRFVLSGHWEDFFVPASLPPRPIPFLNVDQYVRRTAADVARLISEIRDALQVELRPSGDAEDDRWPAQQPFVPARPRHAALPWR